MNNPEAIPLASEPVDPTAVDRFPPVAAWAISFASWTLGLMAAIVLSYWPGYDSLAATAASRDISVPRSWMWPLWPILRIFFVLVAVELALFIASAAAIGWASGVGENLLVAWQRSLVATWLTTPLAAFAVVATFATSASLERVEAAHWDAFTFRAPPTQPAGYQRSFGWPPPANPTPLTPEQAQFEAELTAYFADRADATTRHVQQSPWAVKHRNAITAWVGSAATLGTLLVLITLGAPHERTRACLAPPLCDSCGYNLRGNATAAVCPECGHPIADSLAPHTRDGYAADQRLALRPTLARAATALLRPRAFGKRIRIAAPIGPLRRQAYTPLIATWALCGAPLTFTLERLTALASPDPPFPEELTYTMALIVGPIAGAALTLLVATQTVYGGAWFDTAYRKKLLRNAPRAGLQCALASGPLVPPIIWAIALASFGAWALHTNWLAGFLDTHFDVNPHVPWWLVVPILGSGLTLTWLARASYQAYRAARYATQ
ncbi:MAG: hypothetical protein AAF078_05110 [Planctomycetota bacterium]